MAYDIIEANGGINWVRLSGTLNVQDFQALQALGRLSLERFGRFRVLVELDGFQGWSREAGWGATSFLEEGDQHSRIAFVGDEKWKDDIFMFTGKPLRDTAIEFFAPDRLDQAQAWLSA